jgi:hypothetical protein
MITITPDNQIDRDGEIIGNIIGNIAWMNAKPAPRIIGQIRQIAGIDGLTFEVAEAPTVNESLTVEPISAPEVVGNPPASEPAASCDDLAAGITFAIGFEWGAPGTPYFARCFVNHYGNDAYSQFCKANGI